MHTKGIIAAFYAIVAVLIFVTPAFAQEQDAAQFAFEPTGDALWDTYAQALLEQLPGAPFDIVSLGSRPIAIPAELIDSWEAEFSDDPRYWQLRYVNAFSLLYMDQYLSGENDGAYIPIEMLIAKADPVVYLEEAVDRGVADAMTLMLLYEEQSDALTEQWDEYNEQLDAGETPEFVPEIYNDVRACLWIEQREFELVDNLVKSCPDESWAWYTRAIKRFDYGDWEGGLSDLKTGNQAPNNRLPMPFPLSHAISLAAAGEPDGSETALGIVADQWMFWRLPNYIRVKDHLKNQQVRLELGAALSELGPWHHYTCRLGMMENAPAVQWLVALVIRNSIIRTLLVDCPEAFDRDQRNDLFTLYSKGMKIKELVKYPLQNAREVDEQQDRQIAVLNSHGIEWEDLFTDEAEDLIDNPPAELKADLQAELYHQSLTQMIAEFGEIAVLARDCFEEQAAFDFTTFSWPPEEEEPLPVEPTVLPEPAHEERLTTVILETTKGNIELTVHHGWAPVGAARFIELVETGYYDGAPWFRVVENFVAQCGIAADPSMTAKWQDNTFPDEPVVKGNTRGMVAFGKSSMPDSRSTHIYINLVDNSPGLDPQGFSSFAEVTGGMDVADSLLVTGSMNVVQAILCERGIEYFYELFPEGDIIIRAYIP